MANDEPRRPRGRRRRSRESNAIAAMLGFVIVANVIFGIIVGTLIYRAYQ